LFFNGTGTGRDIVIEHNKERLFTKQSEANMNLFYNIAYIILLNAIVIKGEWEGCSLSLGSEDNTVKSGEVSTVCLTVGPSTDWGANNTDFDYNRFTFQPKADEFSHMHIDGCES
jgi:hypothetical protein